MRWPSIVIIALTLIISGCANDKAQDEPQKDSEATTSARTVAETGTSEVATSGANKTPEEQTRRPKAVSEKESATESEKEADGTQYIVYYMTTSARCASCYKIENWTKGAVNKYFADEIKSGEMKFEMVNIEEPEHEHYIEHYDLFTKSVIVSKEVDGKEVSWKNLARVWKLLRDQNKFMSYVRDEIKAFKSGAEN